MSNKPTFWDVIKKIRITHNLGLKILAFVISFGLWLVVVNVTDPVSTQTYRNVSVKLFNTRIITEEGKTLEIVDGSDTIATVIVKAPRTVIQEFGNNNDNIVATADLRNLSSDETYVPIDVSVSKYMDKVETIKLSDNFLRVKIENRKSITLPITATTSGEIEEGYIIGDIKTAQNQVKISGPESVVSRIASAAVDVQVTGFTSDISTTSDIELLDENGETIDKGNLELNINNVRVDVEILATKRVPVYFAVSGIPSEGCELTGDITSTIDTMLIAGKQSVIDSIASINVPSTVLNVNGHDHDMTLTLNMADYLPSHVRVGDDTWDGLVNVTVGIEKCIEQEFSTYLRNVDIQSGPDGFEVDWAESKDYIEFTLVGLKRNLQAISLGDMDLNIDFGDYSMTHQINSFKAGTYELILNMKLPDNVSLKESVTLKVKLTEIKKSNK